MKKALLEKAVVAVLFVVVLVLFSFAERDRKKLFKSYYGHDMVNAPVQKTVLPTGTAPVAAATPR